MNDETDNDNQQEADQEDAQTNQRESDQIDAQKDQRQSGQEDDQEKMNALVHGWIEKGTGRTDGEIEQPPMP